MASPIVLTGLAANDPVPGRYFETNFAQGPVAGSSATYAILLIGNKTSAGSATTNTTIYGPDTHVQAQSEGDIISLFGSGSPLHRAFLRITDVTHDVPVYFIVVPESAGAAATGTVTIATNAAADGTLRVWVGDEYVETAITSGDTPTTIAAHAVVDINAKTAWPVTASSALGVVTLTAKTKGPRGNFIRYMASVVSSGAIGTTVTPTADTAFTGGTTADDNTAALATILSKRFYYVVSEAEDATQFGAVANQVNTMAAPTTGIRERCFAGSVDTLSNTTTIATGRNTARGELVWQKNSVWTPFELAANAAAVYALFEQDRELSFVEFGNDPKSQPYWKVPPQRDVAAQPTRTDLKTALNNGITPIAVNAGGQSTYLVDRITTRSLSGSTPDYRIRDAHKVSVVDWFADDWGAKIALQFARKRIADDPKQGQPLPSSKVVTPTVVKMSAFGLIDDFDSQDLLQDVDLIKQQTVVQREANPRTRMTSRIPLRPIDILKQWGIAIDQVA